MTEPQVPDPDAVLERGTMGDDKKPTWEPTFWVATAIGFATAILADVIATVVEAWLMS